MEELRSESFGGPSTLIVFWSRKVPLLVSNNRIELDNSRSSAGYDLRDRCVTGVNGSPGWLGVTSDTDVDAKTLEGLTWIMDERYQIGWRKGPKGDERPAILKNNPHSFVWQDGTCAAYNPQSKVFNFMFYGPGTLAVIASTLDVSIMPIVVVREARPQPTMRVPARASW